MTGQRVRIILTALLVEGADLDDAGAQVFDLVGDDPEDVAPLVAEVENYDVEAVE